MVPKMGLKISAKRDRRSAVESELIERAAIVGPITFPGGGAPVVGECAQMS